MRPPARILAAIALVLAALPLQARQAPPLLDLVVEQLAEYLSEYERSLGALVADEQYEQRELRRRASGLLTARRRLESQIGFMRLPGDDVWFGLRDVRRVDDKPVPAAGGGLADLFGAPGADFVERATAIVTASTQYNLGGRRTINMPTVPLEALSARNHPRFIFKLRGNDRVRGAQTRRLEFEEFAEPTLVYGTEEVPLWSRGIAWVEQETGALWRAELIVGPDAPGKPRRLQLESRVRVEFAMEPTLKMLVPIELQEEFWIARGRGSGRATYSNFRRFSTSARLVGP